MATSNRQMNIQSQEIEAKVELSQFFSSIGKNLYLDPETADIHFIVGKQDENCEWIPAHKLLLTTASEAFRAMFNGLWKESNEVRLVAGAASFRVFLKFFYMNEVELTMDIVQEVMNLGQLYDFTGSIRATCVNFLRTTMTEENVLWVYGLAILYDQADLRRLCEIVIGINAKDILKSSSFLQCEKAVVGEILMLDAMKCTETELFEAVMSWVKVKSKEKQLSREIVRAQLGNLFGGFRFASMTKEEFSTLGMTHGHLFSEKEYQDIMRLIESPEFRSQQFNFNRKKRIEKTFWDDQNMVFFNRLISGHKSTQPYYIEPVETTTFSASEFLLLRRFECVRIAIYNTSTYYSLSGSIPTTITINQVSSYENAVPTVLFRTNSCFRSGSSIDIELSEPILIKPGIKYQIRFQQNPPRNFCSGHLLMSEMHKSGVTVQFHDCTMIDNDKNSRDLVYKFVFHKI